MQPAVDLKHLSVPEKVELMEALWDDLCDDPNDIAVPEWHKELLDERERQVARGEARFIDWETAKRQLADRTKTAE